jgi:hypothetical protein
MSGSSRQRFGAWGEGPREGRTLSSHALPGIPWGGGYVLGNSLGGSSLALALLFLAACPIATSSQVISPGKLSEAHAHLEGVRNCTQCHRLRSPGVDRERCLECHQPLAHRIKEGEGYHGSLPDPDCGSCHKEHLGKSFRVTHFDAESFAHDSTGYTLRGRHAEAACRDCHRRELVVSQDVREFKETGGALDRTYMGLGTDCATCHGGDDPHEDQFSDRDCSTCHSEEGWEGAEEFDHSAARYPLEGRHREVECRLCHKTPEGGARSEAIRYRPLDASTCGACHEDPHGGGMRGPCAACHVPEGWGQVRKARVESSFDHGTTGFPLTGAHADARCGSCHTPGATEPGLRLVFPRGEVGGRTYPRPRYDRCSDCHSDPHSGAFETKECDDCHSGEVWVPAAFGLARHDEDSRFPLTGAHRVTPCVACHQVGEEGDPLLFRVAGFEDCRSCHREDDPHEGAFGDARCETCHETRSFLMEEFDHDREEVRKWIQQCSACHGPTQPHGEQFGDRECRECHSTSTFRISVFDHSRTRFLLDGAHEKLACDQCHLREGGSGVGEGGTVRYRPLEISCIACHGATT